MHRLLDARPARYLYFFVIALLLGGCFGEGDGPQRIPGTPPPPLIGVLVDAPVSGVEWETTSGTSGLTNTRGEFEYIAGDRVTFSIGGIVLGTVTGAPIVTAVELTGSDDPTDAAATNMLIFLQSIDSDANPDNGIDIAASARSAAGGLSLDFSASDFGTAVASVVAALAPGNRVVSAGDALLHFYQTYAAMGGTDTFNFLFPGFPPVGGGVEFELVFSDEFNEAGAPSAEKWNIEEGYGDNGWGNNEWQLYTDSPDNVRVEDGNLVIQARCSTPPCGVRDGSITSARITTQDKFEFRYGKVVARIKPPVGKAAWPAFWSLGANFPEIGWPRSGEIDFMEMHNFFSDDRTTHFTMHWCDQTIQAPLTCSFPEGHRFDSQQTSFASSLGDDFHVFEADWDENRIVGKIDGIQYFERTIDAATMEEFRRDFFLILNVAMGGTLGSNSQPPDGDETFPQTMLVDYVRVFQRIDGGDDEFQIDFENAPETYDFGESGGFEGGASAVVANPVAGGINPSAQVARMLKFMGAPFAGSLLTLPSPVTVETGSRFSMKVWSPRAVNVLLKLEGDFTETIERNVPHGGTGWEELIFDFTSFSDTITGLTFIFDLGIPGDAGGDPDNWTFYFDDITLLPPEDTGEPMLDQVDLPITFDDPNVDYTFADFGDPVAPTTTLVLDPVVTGNIVASTTKPPGAPIWAGTTIGASGLATPIPFTADDTTIGMRVFSPDAGIPVRLKAETADGSVSVETEVMTTAAGRWQTLVFDMAEPVVGAGIDLSADYTVLSVFFNFGTDGDTAGEKTYLFDTIEFGVPKPVVDTMPPTLSRVTIESDNTNPGFAITGNTVTVTLTASEPIMRPAVTIAGEAADTITGAGANWQATRTITGAEAEGAVTFAISYSDLAGNPGDAVSTPTEGGTVIADFTPPAVAILGAPAAFTSLDAIPLTFQFSEAVSGFTLADIVVSNGIASGLVIVDPANYTANVTPDGTDALTVTINPGAAIDSAGNPLVVAETVTVLNELDADAPRLLTVGISSSNANPAWARTGDVVTLTMTANEEIVEPDVTIAGQPASTVSGAGTTWEATRTMQATDPEGVVTFAIEFEDLGGNPGPRTTITTAPFPTVTFDITGPTPDILGMPATIDTLDAFAVTLQFDEPVEGFEAGDVTVTNGTAAAFTPVDDTSWTVEITPDGGGDLTVAIGADVAADLAGNLNSAASVTSTLNLVPFWQLVWSDEFTGASLSTTNWTRRTDADCPAPCDGLQAYIADAVSVAGGVLMVEARDDGVSPTYTSGLIDTRGKRELLHGRIEIDAKLPGTNGTRPSLWLAPAANTYGEWPQSGQIDIVNAPDLGLGGATTIEHATRYGLPEPEDTFASASSPVPAMVSTEFSTYALEWEGGELRWFVNGVHVATQVQDHWYAYSEDTDGVFTLGAGAAPFDEPFYLVLNMTIDEVGGSGYPHTLEVGAVRVYRCANPVDPAAGTGCEGLIDAVDPAITPVVATPAPYDDMPFTSTLSAYTDAPATLDFIAPDGSPTAATLVPYTFTSDAGVSVTSTIDAVDGANTIWNVAVAAPAGSGGVAMGPGDFGSSTGFFDLSGGDTAGEVLFRMRVNSASGDPTVSARLDSPSGTGSQALSWAADGSWVDHSVKIADLVADSVMLGTALDLDNVIDLFVLEVAGGTVNLDLDDIRTKVACRDTGRCEAVARISEPAVEVFYMQDFEGMVVDDAGALANDKIDPSKAKGWQVFGNVFQPDGVTYIRGYGPFDAPNPGAGFSALVNDQGGPEQGMIQLSIYSDYGNNADHSAGNVIESNVFQEHVLGADDVGSTWEFVFNAKKGNIEGASTAAAFFKVLNPMAGFSLTEIVTADMTSIPDTWKGYSVTIDIPPEWEGQLLQFGFLNTATSFAGSGIFYDNIEVRKTVP